MKRQHFRRIKVLLIGFVLTKVVVTLGYLLVTSPVTDFFWAQKTVAAQAKAAVQKPKTAVQDPKVAAQKPEADASSPAPGKAAKGVNYADLQAVMEQLDQKRATLDAEEAHLKQERAQLVRMKQDIDQRMDKLKAVQVKIDTALAKKAQMEAQEKQQQSAAEAAKVRQLVKVYSSMSPKKAAAIIDKLDMKVVYEVFSNMKGQQVGQILTYVDGDRAAKITERMAENISK